MKKIIEDVVAAEKVKENVEEQINRGGKEERWDASDETRSDLKSRRCEG